MFHVNELFTRISESLFLIPSYIKNLSLCGHKNYIFLTPPFLSKQIIYSKHSKTFIRYNIRSVDQLKVAIQIFADEEYSDPSGRLKKIYRDLLSQNKTPLILDIGANIGLASLYFHDNYPLARVVAIEPSRNSFQLCVNNLPKTDLFTISQCAISGFSGYGKIANPGSPSWARLIEEVDGDENNHNDYFRVFTLDELYELSLFSRDLSPFILKLDVEGAESEIFDSQPICINKFPVLFIETHDFMFPNKGHARPVLKALSALNNDFLIRGENILSIANE